MNKTEKLNKELDDFLKDFHNNKTSRKAYCQMDFDQQKGVCKSNPVLPHDDYSDFNVGKCVFIAVVILLAYVTVCNLIPMLDLRITAYIDAGLDPSLEFEEKCAWVCANWWKFPMYTFVGLTAITLVISAIGRDFHIRPMLYAVLCIFNVIVGLPALILVVLVFCVVCGFMYWLGGVFLLLFFLIKVFGADFFCVNVKK